MSRPVIQQFAGHYRNLGFDVLPLVGKKCVVPEWPDKSFTVDSFDPTDNIGIRGMKGLVVLDDDFPTSEAACAEAFLPATGAVYGRPKKPRSKRLFRCPDLSETITFTDINGDHLVQLRVGHTVQDMCPPSVHPDTGERLKWDGLLTEPRTVPLGIFIESVRAYWAARLIAKYWPDRSRHQLRLAFARVLVESLALPDTVAVAILEWTCRLGGSDNKGIQDARSAIASTREKLAAKQPTTGAASVAAVLGDTGRQIVRLLRRAYGKTDATEEAIERLNERNAIVSVGNKVVVMETWPDGGVKELWHFEEFKRRHTKEYVEIGGKRKPLADVWLHDARGRQYDRLVFVMAGSVETFRPGDYNGWLGFTVMPLRGDWSKNREHLHRIICGGNTPFFTWVYNWIAALVQWPGRHAFTAIVLRGGQGTGKGHFAHLMLGALFHPQQYLHIIGGGMLTGRFNEHLSGKVLVFADESTWGGDPAAAEKLKGMVTESTIPIERKFLPLVEEPSALHIVVASNNEWPIAIAMDDRRFMVLDVLDTERQNDAYFAPLREELKAGGLAAMLHDLLAHTVDEHALRHPPTTRAKREVMTQSLKPIERWWYEKLLSGSLAFNTMEKDGDIKCVEGWPTSIDKVALHEDYLAFLDKHHRDGRTRRSTQTELGMFLAKYTRLYEQRRLVGMSGAQYVWNIPSLLECRAFWANACGWPEDFDWDDEGR